MEDGRAWFERFQEAFLACDLETIWSLQTEASHEIMLAQMAETIQLARRDSEFHRTLRDRLGPDIRELEPRAAWEAYTTESCHAMAAGVLRWRFVGEERDGERIVVTMAPEAGNRPLPGAFEGEMVQVLVREAGEFRLDKPASTRLQNERAERR